MEWRPVVEGGIPLLKWVPPDRDPWDLLAPKSRWRYAYQAARTTPLFTDDYYNPLMRPLFLIAQKCISARERQP